MNVRTLIALEAVTVPVGYGFLDVTRTILLAILVLLSFVLFVWMGRAARNAERHRAGQRVKLRRLREPYREQSAGEPRSTLDA
ncbi:hypothetical protein [Erythrobacter sp. JK5]|uniref:hypothetical protein n=1 Tax=Erythrobacter sp. JK5 TaxID=2829500 RepID=UPI001BAC04CF|nr:hypothetical protein [Erythrobacter sp. JK5]QUL36808.1 hypothetical protein KDC96_10305 [Erythrobacter sp. JK5]